MSKSFKVNVFSYKIRGTRIFLFKTWHAKFTAHWSRPEASFFFCASFLQKNARSRMSLRPQPCPSPRCLSPNHAASPRVAPPLACRGAWLSRVVSMILHEKGFRLSGNEDHYTNSLMLLVNKMLCSKLDCQKVLDLKLFSLKIAPLGRRAHAPCQPESPPCQRERESSLLTTYWSESTLSS